MSSDRICFSNQLPSDREYSWWGISCKITYNELTSLRPISCLAYKNYQPLNIKNSGEYGMNKHHNQLIPFYDRWRWISITIALCHDRNFNSFSLTPIWWQISTNTKSNSLYCMTNNKIYKKKTRSQPLLQQH